MAMGLKGARVLIADDEEMITSLLSQILIHEGADVAVAHNGQDAFHLAMMNDPHCILMDLRMPGVNGFEAIESLRLIMKSRPIIVVSAYTDHENVRKAKEAGADAVMGKPFNTALLLKTISDLLDREGRQEGESPSGE